MRALESLRGLIERALLSLWYAPPGAWRSVVAAALLAPLTALVAAASRRRARSTRRLPPDARPAVVVIGNLVVGGTGKTPATIAVAQALRSRGWRVGLLAGGYRARRDDARIVRPGDDAGEHGDEPVLLAAQTGLPTAAGRRRADALDRLLAAHPGLEIVLSDDGLQHAGLPRTLEIAVFDARGAGNGRLLPAGPLREPLDRLARVDAVLLNGTGSAPPGAPLCFGFRVEPLGIRPLAGGSPVDPREFAERCANLRVAALAGIAQPARFFATLRALGIDATPVPLPDHAPIDARMLASIPADIVVMTSKDAVKCGSAGDGRCWVLEIGARIDPAFIVWIEERLRGQPSA